MELYRSAVPYSIPAPSKCIKYSFSKNIDVVQWDDLTVLNVIGRGQFGEVSRVKYKEQDLVAKRLLSQHEEERKIFLKESNIMSQLSHPNVMSVKIVCPDHCAIIMEYIYGI